MFNLCIIRLEDWVFSSWAQGKVTQSILEQRFLGSLWQWRCRNARSVSLCMFEPVWDCQFIDKSFPNRKRKSVKYSPRQPYWTLLHVMYTPCDLNFETFEIRLGYTPLLRVSVFEFYQLRTSEEFASSTVAKKWFSMQVRHFSARWERRKKLGPIPPPQH